MVLEFFFGILIVFISTLPSLFLPVSGNNQVYLIKSLFLFHFVTISSLFSVFVFVSGSLLFGFFCSIFLFYIFSLVSCVKYRILREPVYFSDIISLGVLIKNPKFFIFSIPPLAWFFFICLILSLPLLLWHYFSDSLSVRFYALIVFWGAYQFYKKFSLDLSAPDWQRDVGQIGIGGMLILYWIGWKKQPAPQPLPVTNGKAKLDIVLVVQCESFADPSIFHEAKAETVSLPFLEKARSLACTKGNFLVSGFGAYTMRTEYGVMFGRTEADLKFCQYDPFLTAQRDKTYSLPYQLKAAGYQTMFMHPHSLEFYGRNKLMPTIGFDVVDDCSVFEAHSDSGNYMSDTLLADAIIQKLETAKTPLFLYAVTMENHAPWPGASQEALGHYLRHLQNSDTMLGRLIAWLEMQDKRALFVFFGDHRPSIPGVMYRDKGRSTPYVALGFPFNGNQNLSTEDVTPAELHHLIKNFSLTSL